MRLDGATARRLFASVPVVRLATVGVETRPHLVPIVFALSDADLLYTAVDDKPKASTALRRLANIAANPAVSVLADHYEDDWSRLWWVRADGTARVHGPGTEEAHRARPLLAERYPAYAAAPPSGPVVSIHVERWSGWSAGDLPATRSGNNGETSWND